MSDQVYPSQSDEQLLAQVCILCNKPLLFLCDYCLSMACEIGVHFNEFHCPTFRTQQQTFHQHCLERTIADYLRYVTGYRWYRFR